MAPKKVRELKASEVRYRADLSSLPIRTSDDLSAAVAIVGQSEALQALEMGLQMRQPGYHVFLAGMKGTGRFAAVREMIRQAIPVCARLLSHGYVYNFRQHDEPLLVTLPAGKGKEFQSAVEGLRMALREAVPALLMSDVLARSRQRLMAKYERETRRVFGGFDQRVASAGFALVQTEAAEGAVQMADVLPVVKGEPVQMDQVRADPVEAGLEPAQVGELDRRRSEFKEELSGLVVRHRQIGARYKRLIKDSETRKMGEALKPLFDDVRAGFGEWDPVVASWLDGTRDELLEHLDSFREGDRQSGQGGNSQHGPRIDDFLGMVQVNLLWDPGPSESGATPCPVVEENFPTWRNLFGGIEASGEPPMASFLDVRAGSLLKAGGGYLLLSARDVLTEPRVYDHLKRVLRRGLLEIAPREDGHTQQCGIKPVPIPLEIKVVLIGESGIYDLLHASDPDFPKIFKIKAEFDDSMTLSPGSTGNFLSVLKRIISQNKLPPFERGALEVALEEGVRLAGTRSRLTTQFSDVADVMREATHIATFRGAKRVSARDMTASLELRRWRHALPERRFLDLLRDGKLLVEVDGTRVGQVNGLGYYDLDYIQFGMPARISATCSSGRTGVVNIEREAQLSGSIHDKGVLILSGFLASTFAQDKPLSLHANIVFEQSYAMVDGDSASLAELLALLSALSRVPLRQELAVTGSLNQRGGVQPVGGVTEKTDGFFRAARILGLTGRQGVVMPIQNTQDLHLARDTCDAIRQHKFHVYPVADFSEALELLTGRPPKEILAACDKTLAAYAAVVRDFK